ncbi:hypothetical protein TBLA_0B09800 [Henningerozyma blattae CBS 6284]|uniref:Hydrophilin n=1 Tax=Henningerozyma blattae (strain ATCC 34711 / CBS 6284 / DSM 70876 / NBRC 10599 / NRRL Y-10934 / UCD 77-7) TaxID=1071380 RepID=I2H094_HENB6|nr:hypothetical protein TBLA_0B09800 [Tetrapisispora blattae CBS 6284]CCH59796.1 hypothetical protein TBLA_0B09800 [Tetrapisispora blattae CBS 6284]
MRYSAVSLTLLATLASFAVAKDKDTTEENKEVTTLTSRLPFTDTTHNTKKYGKFNKTKKSHKPTISGTKKYGKFNKTKKSHKPTISGTKKYGKFNKTKKSHKPTISGTHKYGKFNKTKKSHKPTISGTHKYGKFNKTKKSHKPTISGTHKYGKFNKTKKSHKTHFKRDIITEAPERPQETEPVEVEFETEDIETRARIVERDIENVAGMNSMNIFGMAAGPALVAGALLLL